MSELRAQRCARRYIPLLCGRIVPGNQDCLPIRAEDNNTNPPPLGRIWHWRRPVVRSQRFSLPSSPAAAIVRPSGLKAAVSTRPSFRKRLPKGFLECLVHICTPPSDPAVIKVSPFRVKAIALIDCSCVARGLEGRPLAICQTRAVLSALAVTSMLWFGLNAAARTAPACRTGEPRGVREAVCQSLAVPSLLPVKNERLSGLKPTVVTSPSW